MIASQLLKIAAALATVCGYAVGQEQPAQHPLPIVDLGYELHQANNFNESGGYYNFTDIRFGAPPLDDLRFAKPQPPAVNRSEVQKGGQGYVCPQALPRWLQSDTAFLSSYLTGATSFATYNASSPLAANGSSVQVSDRPGLTVTEDCLFLDVIVPRNIFERAGKGYGAPVMVWIYGGGFILGSKSDFSPTGLIASSQTNGSDGMINYYVMSLPQNQFKSLIVLLQFVALNYRLGAFGWLSGPTFQKNGTANAGLYDQLLALEWVQANIAKFGGDPRRVTVAGESAGGSSILHQITAFGGAKGPVPFAQAIPQSTAFLPVVSNSQQEDVLSDFLSRLNVSTIDQARTLPSSLLQQANTEQVAAAIYGGFVYGPVVDGDFTPALPPQLLQRGQFDAQLSILSGQCANEGLMFTSPNTQTPSGALDQIRSIFPSLRGLPNQLEYLTQTLYGDNPNNASTPRDSISRVALMISEGGIGVNTVALHNAFPGSYGYLFAIPPALHGADSAYTFYTGPAPNVDPTTARTLQSYITNFVMTGNPNSRGVPYFPQYGSNSTVQTFNVSGISQFTDPFQNKRTDWWLKGVFF